MPARPSIVDILNCFGPGGQNIAQLVTYADGSLNAYGDASFIRAATSRHGIPLTPALTAALARCEGDFLSESSSPISKRKTRKASSSETADGLE